MTGYITTGTGKSIATEYKIKVEGDELMVIFEFNWDPVIAWDIERITLQYGAGHIVILTGRGNALGVDSEIGKQLLDLAGPLLRVGLFEALTPAEQTEMVDFALNAFDKLTTRTLEELTSYDLIQSYNNYDYRVSFRKDPKSNPNDREWTVAHIERTIL